MKFRENVLLEDRIAAFIIPLFKGLKNNFTALQSAPEPILLLIAAKGVEASGTHSREEIEKALRCALPE